MMKRLVASSGILLFLLLLGQFAVYGQEEPASQKRMVQSWSLEFRADRPQLYIHETPEGKRIPYLYITYTLRNNYGRKVPLQMNFALKTGEDTYLHPTSNPKVEHEIISKEARLSGFSKGVQRVKIKNLKKEGKYLTVDDLNRGFYLHYVKGEGLEQSEIELLSTRSLGASEGSNGRIPYQVLIRKGPSDRQGKPYERLLTDHPAEIKGLLLFKDLDMDTRDLTLKVGDLVDPIVRASASRDVPEPKKYRLEPRTLHVHWSWDVPRTKKRDTGPEFVSRKMVRERFGPVVSHGTIRKLIDYLSVDLGSSPSGSDDEASLNKTLRATALQTLREISGNNYGYDPSASVSENKEALERWNEWWGRNKHDLLYVLTMSKEGGRNTDVFYQYPRPHYIALKKRVGISGYETPQKLFSAFRTAWNEQRWQDVLDKLVIDQRNRETIKTLLMRYGLGTKIGPPKNFQDADEEGRRVVLFDAGGEARELHIVQEDEQWYLAVGSKGSNEE